jgi:hypothetical protein
MGVRENVAGMLGMLSFKLRRGDKPVRKAATYATPVHHIVYENKRQPDGFGASRYAYELLQLAPVSPINGAVRVRRQISFPFGPPQVWAAQAVKVNPIPSQAGGIFSGGMLNADGTLPALGTDNPVSAELLALNDANVNANNVSALYGRNDPSGYGR